MEHPKDVRVMIPVDHPESPFCQGKPCPRYRILAEGFIENYDGWTIPTPKNPFGLDMNRNFPAGWGKQVKGSGDHALSEPEIYALVRAITERPNICGYNAYHTNGGVLLRPSSTKADSELPPSDVWVFNEVLIDAIQLFMLQHAVRLEKSTQNLLAIQFTLALKTIHLISQKEL